MSLSISLISNKCKKIEPTCGEFFFLQCTSYLYYAWSKMTVFKDEWTLERLLIRAGNYMRRSVWYDGCIDPNKNGNLFVFLDNITINPLRVARNDIWCTRSVFSILSKAALHSTTFCDMMSNPITELWTSDVINWWSNKSSNCNHIYFYGTSHCWMINKF